VVKEFKGRSKESEVHNVEKKSKFETFYASK